MTELTARQQELLDELQKDFKGDVREIFGESGLLKTGHSSAVFGRRHLPGRTVFKSEFPEIDRAPDD